MISLFRIRQFFGLALLAAALVLWVWILWPAPQTEQTIPLPEISSSDPQFSDIGARINDLALQIHLRHPVWLHLGDTGTFTAKVTSAAEPPGRLPMDAQVMAEARLEMPLIKLDPQAGIQETFSADSLPVFVWRMQPGEKGGFEGGFWFYLLFVPADGSVERQALLSIPLEVHVYDFWGLSEKTLIWTALLLMLAGLLMFPFAASLRKRK
jgi:hypothetical protein